MLQAIKIENFKGIGAPVTVEFRPVTFLFGPNSAGKSTILDALHFAREIFCNRNPNPEVTDVGGEVVELGGFRALVHGRDLTNVIRLTFFLAVDGFDLGDLPLVGAHSDWFDHDELGFSGIESTQIQIEIAWSNLTNRPLIKTYRVFFNSVEFARIEHSEKQPAFFLLNPNHPVLELDSPEATIEREEADSIGTVSLDGYRDLLRKFQEMYSDEDAVKILDLMPPIASVVNCTDALPRFDKVFRVVDPGIEDQELFAMDESHASFVDKGQQKLDALLSRLICGVGQLFADFLNDFRYIGPIRKVPGRYDQFVAGARRYSWADGQAAWERLYLCSEELFSRISDWLGDASRLNTGYRLRRRKFVEVDLANPLFAKLLEGRAFDEVEAEQRLKLEELEVKQKVELIDATNDDGLGLSAHDVGEGVAQVVPVVVGLLDHDVRERIIAIEQPELHLHPRIQAELGDLIIESTLGRKRELGRSHQVLIETHSEHVILRILRRIRESSDQVPLPMSITPDDVAVIYVTVDDGETKLISLRIDEGGEFIDRWPGGFFEERAKELF